jgi:hypothetical protein
MSKKVRRKKFNVLLIIAFIPVLLFLSNATIAASEYDFYFLVESFTWEEFSGSSRLLEESGPLYGIGFTAKDDEIYEPLTLKFKGEGFFGSVDYDGQTQGGTPVTTDTDYVGFKAEIDGGWKFPIGEAGSSFEPFAGLGGRWWKRDIQSTSSAIGLEEDWSSYYGRLGIRGENISPNQLIIFIEVAAILPFKNENEVDFSSIGIGQVTVEPENETSLWAEAGIKFKKLRVSVFYEGLRFAESDKVGPFLVFQPESKADIYGANIGYVF